MALTARPIAHAVLDNRDAGPGDLFVALPGQRADGHDYIGLALSSGAQAVICEPRGREAAVAQGAAIVDCTHHRGPVLEGDGTAVEGGEVTRALEQGAVAYIVPNSQQALQTLGAFQRLHRCHPDLRTIGITGSVGKSSTKELAAAVLRQHFNTLHSPGSLNNEQGLPFTLLGLGWHHERAVLEMGTYGIGEIREFCTWVRPHVGVITNIGPVHLERMGTLERIAQAKAELIQALPSGENGGVAILNWDDERIRPMAALTDAHVFRYGLTPDADLWADEIQSAGLNGIRFRFHYRKPAYQASERAEIESLHVRVPLLGRHSVHTALRAAAVGLVEGLSWEEIIAGMQSSPNQLRLVVVPGINQSTVLDDTYNASPASTVAALNLLSDLEPNEQGRRVAVLGDMLELGSFTEEGHKLVGRRAAGVVDVLLTVGELGRRIGKAALDIGFAAEQVHILENHEQTIELLHELITPGDLILVKGSRAVGMDAIAADITLPRERSTGKPV
jgi:UDP-N-acetylmuramoyl-tripeptide--D-alanyl-D-alanine ligase